MKKTRTVRKYKSHKNTMLIHVLDPYQCEDMKTFWDIEENSEYSTSMLVHYSHWQRFLNTIAKDEIGPSLEEYIEWKKEYPGWSHAFMTPSHAAWKKEYKNRPFESFPMNKLEKKEE